MSNKVQTPATMLAAIGTALYGEGRWYKPLARDLGAHENQLRRWMENGGARLSADHELFARALALLQRRRHEIGQTALRLSHWHKRAGQRRSPKCLASASRPDTR